MNKQALAEDMVELWDQIRDVFHRKYNEEPSPDEHIAIFEQAMKWRMTQDIKAQRSGVPSDKKKKPFKKKATGGAAVTQKQRDFIEDLGGDPDSVSTVEEASDYIEELKEG